MPAGYAYHVMNRGVSRMGLFADAEDYETFLNILEAARKAISMRVCGYCVMPNHWHLALWPSADNIVQRFLYRLTSEHVRHWRKRWETAGHVYQGRYRAFVVSTDDYYLNLLRYIERNPVRAKLTMRPQDWRWSSAYYRRSTGSSPLVTLDAGPVALPRNWLELIAVEG